MEPMAKVGVVEIAERVAHKAPSEFKKLLKQMGKAFKNAPSDEASFSIIKEHYKEQGIRLIEGQEKLTFWGRLKSSISFRWQRLTKKFEKFFKAAEAEKTAQATEAAAAVAPERTLATITEKNFDQQAGFRTRLSAAGPSIELLDGATFEQIHNAVQTLDSGTNIHLNIILRKALGEERQQITSQFGSLSPLERIEAALAHEATPQAAKEELNQLKALYENQLTLLKDAKAATSTARSVQKLLGFDDLDNVLPTEKGYLDSKLIELQGLRKVSNPTSETRASLQKYETNLTESLQNMKDSMSFVDEMLAQPGTSEEVKGKLSALKQHYAEETARIEEALAKDATEQAASQVAHSAADDAGQAAKEAGADVVADAARTLQDDGFRIISEAHGPTFELAKGATLEQIQQATFAFDQAITHKIDDIVTKTLGDNRAEVINQISSMTDPLEKILAARKAIQDNAQLDISKKTIAIEQLTQLHAHCDLQVQLLSGAEARAKQAAGQAARGAGETATEVGATAAKAERSFADMIRDKQATWDDIAAAAQREGMAVESLGQTALVVDGEHVAVNVQKLAKDSNTTLMYVEQHTNKPLARMGLENMDGQYLKLNIAGSGDIAVLLQDAVAESQKTGLKILPYGGDVGHDVKAFYDAGFRIPQEQFFEEAAQHKAEELFKAMATRDPKVTYRQYFEEVSQEGVGPFPLEYRPPAA